VTMDDPEMRKAAHRWADEFYSHDRFHDETHWNTAVNAYAAGWKARASAGDGVLTDADVAAALVVLARDGIAPDIQELLVRGNPSQGVRPGALARALSRIRSGAG
jgi:hypothetical protein